MHIEVIVYRNKNDFAFGSFHIRTGEAWLEILGRLKKTGKETTYAKLLYSPGKGKVITQMKEEDELCKTSLSAYSD